MRDRRAAASGGGVEISEGAGIKRYGLKQSILVLKILECFVAARAMQETIYAPICEIWGPPKSA